jgi:chromosome segregation ATPase
MNTTIETDLKEILGSIQGELKEIRKDLGEMRVAQADLRTEMRVAQADLRGDIKALDEKVTGLGKRIENQEFLNRGVLTALIVALVAGAAKLFGWLPTA